MKEVMKLRWLALAALLLLMTAAPAAAATLWYNGDFSGPGSCCGDYSSIGCSFSNSYEYESYSDGYFSSEARTYDDFVVPEGGWKIDSVWSNNCYTSSVVTTGATYEIRSGMSEGNGGTIVASGTGTWSLTETGRTSGGYTEYQLTISGLDIDLDPGTYWLSVTPTIAALEGRSYNSATSGANAIGTPAGNNGNSLVYVLEHFVLAGDWLVNNYVAAPGNADYSKGIGGAMRAARAFSVDVDDFMYTDDSGRRVEYDFSSGAVGTNPPNAIFLDSLTLDPGGTSVVTRPSGETDTNYLWGQPPEFPLPALNVSTPAAGKATISVPDGSTEGVAVLFAGGELSSSPTTGATWFYSLTLTNFQVDLTAEKAYWFGGGLGRDEETMGAYNEAYVDVTWVKGFLDGQMYDTATLIVQARVENGEVDIWESEPIIRTGLDPAETTLMFDLSVQDGNNFTSAVSINGGDMINLVDASGNGCTLTTEQGTFLRFPDLYPYIYMEEESASTAPQAGVQSQHWKDQSGDDIYHAGLWVTDPLGQASAVHVTGYNEANVDLVYDANAKSWYNNTPVVIGSAPVTDPFPSYTFAFTPQSGEAAIPSVTKTITGYVTEFATNLQPSGNIATIPTFSWTAAAGTISGYGIELSDASAGNRVWSFYDIPPTQTSVPYAGPALETGKTYNYNIITQIESEDASNASFAQGSFTYTGSAPTNNLLVNGSFSDGLNGWIVNPVLQTGTSPWNPFQDDGTVSLHPDDYGFTGTVLYQNLNLTDVEGKTLNVSVTLTNVSAYGTGNTVSVWLTCVDGSGELVRTEVLNPANVDILSGTVVSGTYTVPVGTQKIVKIELVKGDYGSFNADDVILSADGVTAGAVPAVASLTAMGGDYDTTFTINGSGFGTTSGNVTVGGVPVEIVSWADTEIQARLISPARSGPVVVTTGFVESNLAGPFAVTSPYCDMRVVTGEIKVIKGQKAEFLLKTSFVNDFVPPVGGLVPQLQGGDAGTLAGKITFIPGSIKSPGGMVARIDTAGLAAGDYTADVVAMNGTEAIPAGTLNLRVVTVSSIKFYEYSYDTSTYTYTSTEITSKNATKQGLLDIYTQVVGSDGEVFYPAEMGSSDVAVLTEAPPAGNTPILNIYKDMWGYEIYARNNGSTNLRAIAPDGTTSDLPITVNFPTDSYITSISLSAPEGTAPIDPLYNNRTDPIVFYAEGTTQLGWIGYYSPGMMGFNIDFLDKLERSSDGLSATSTFNLLDVPVDLGTAILHVETNDRKAKAAVPLTTQNPPDTGLLSAVVKPLDSNVFAEMFTLYFYGADDGLLKFSRTAYAMHFAPLVVGNIPPGSYKVLFVPEGDYNAPKPQWWPNAADIAQAAPVVFTAGGAVSDIYYFAASQPGDGTVALPDPPMRAFTQAGGTGEIPVDAPDPAYIWAAASDAPWIRITSGITGIGNGSVSYVVDANPFGAGRSGIITIAGLSYTITQEGTGIIPPWVGTWGVPQLIHFDDGYNELSVGPVPWYAGIDRTTLNEDGTGTMVMKKNDHNGELINTTISFNYTMVKNPDGSLTFSGNVGEGTEQLPFSLRMVIGDDGKMGIVDGTMEEHQQKLMVLYRIDTTKTYSAANANGEYYNVGFERNNTNVSDPPNGNGAYMAISGIHTFDGSGSYTYNALANSLNSAGENLIWLDDESERPRAYDIAQDGTFTAGSGAFQGVFTGDGLVGGGAGAFANGVNNQMAYMFMKKADRGYTTADLAGKWALVSFGQNSQSGGSNGFYSSFGTMICDAAGNCNVRVRDRNSDVAATDISTEQLQLTVNPDGSFGASFGGQSPDYAGAIGNDGNTILINPSFRYAASEDPWNREIVIGIRASGVGDLAGGTAILKGDINGDDKVDLADAVVSLQAMAGMNPTTIRPIYPYSGVDIDNNGKIGLQELLYILQYTAGLR